MKYIKDYKDGDRVFDIYFCKFKSSAVTKNGKNYDNVILQDKTGTIDAKIWDPNNVGIADFEAMDYIEVYGDVTSFNGALQVNVKRVRRCSAGEYDERDYMPVSLKNNDEMYAQLLAYIESIENTYLKALLNKFFVEDKTFVQSFRKSSAAKTREISAFPANDYTDEGQFLGHIVIGSEMLGEKIKEIPDFPPVLAMELKHCILAHHGEYEFGSPKKPAIIEAVALCYADNTDAKMETFKELLESTKETGWLGYNKLFESNLAVSKMK